MARTEETYNGWTNYATWRINLELCEDTCESLRQDGQRFADIGDLADYLKDDVDEAITGYGEREDGIAVDYARAFVSDVNWYEIAEHYTELVREDAENS